MNKKTIVLADNSYTIRRIVELSFSEEEYIELVSFEDGANLKEKLLELKPEIVLVDIKLPEFSGYEVCKFINTTESLTHTKVFLLKGGFEPIDESLLTNLQYASIITKPFDSNALVATIKKILTAPAKSTPAGVPEEAPSFTPGSLPEVENITEPKNEINLPDEKEGIGPDGILSDSAGVGQGPPQYLPSDDVLPSEEITQGAQPEVDALAPTKEEDMDNPFAEPPPADIATQKTLSEEEMDIKMNIQMQEKELDIGSVTQEALQINKKMQEQGTPPPGDQLSMDGEMGAATPGPPEDIADIQPEVKSAGTEGSLQIDDLMGDKKTEEPDMDKYPEIEKALGQEEIDFAKEIKPEDELMASPPSSEAKPEFPEFKPEQQTQEPAAAEEMEFEIPGMAGPADTESEPAETVPDEKETIPGLGIEDQPANDFAIPTAEKSPARGDESEELPSIQKEELLYKVEDKLTHAIKEILWDVVPPMAEKIIKQEIEKLKAEVDKSFEYIEK